ncbi:peptide chain release factor N(5)-glutamine methyltransferase [Neisseria iguanae]|uniref:Release factor glutamine methyltransferase n=1 Tax=Neisseria iguanae TaxID=90242 RepID=A0A2P7U327_9NEIS|nr:peptide chain release factor N(5)-glutamine methyltransferase [Neisseria iguanae]PSJ81357.1 peptide chain release factor N(5)-glutamine methyltransferase [Neisseria iguanae]
MTLEQWLRQSALPKNEARMLLQYISGYSRVQLITQGDAEMPSEMAAKLAVVAQRRLNGEPMAYILGEREFYGRMFAVNRNVLIPRPETEHLVEAAMARLPQGGRVWDLGTGSGAIAATIALERPDAQVRASDISSGALVIAKMNAQNLNASVEFASGPWFDVDRPSEPYNYDVIVSNPPYIEADDEHLLQGDLRFEPQRALTDFSDGLSGIRELAAGAPKYLKSGGWLLLEHGCNQGEAARRILTANGFAQVETLPDLAGLDRITLGQRLA